MNPRTHLALLVGYPPAMAKLCQFVLELAGEFECFETVKQGVMARLGNHHFDIVLIHFSTTTPDLVTEIRASPSHGDVPIMVMIHEGTGDNRRDRAMCLAAGANALVNAPFQVRALIEAIVALVPPR